MQKYIKIIIGSSVLVGIVFSGLYFLSQQKEENQSIMGDEKKKAEQQKKNVQGITQHVLSEENIDHTTMIETRDYQEEEKQWMIIYIENVDKWNEIEEEKQKYIMQGLINTARLQIDRDFGGVQIVDLQNAPLLKGWWSDAQKYVIM
ncbi:MAG: hypothetical protein CR972_04255 [Candidatus Moraniibacteriota bacterium]|nr:MAG: hypothetical protein CR972_04255 [Candidatus Moranbacteria bacterium]